LKLNPASENPTLNLGSKTNHAFIGNRMSSLSHGHEGTECGNLDKNGTY
jgi:hypothetical protein